MTSASVADRLRAAGCVAADDEAAELIEAAGGDAAALEAMVARRASGEPLAWITGSVSFLGAQVAVDAGVYVPRWQTEVVAARAATLLTSAAAAGIAVDLCTGSGAVAAHLSRSCPGALVVASDIDPVAVACARRNGVDARFGDLDAPLDPSLAGRVDVLVAIPPYVPSVAVPSLARDVVAFEPLVAIDGGAEGLAVLDRIAALAPRWLRPGGALVVELGGDGQSMTFAARLRRSGFTEIATLVDPDGDPCGVEARKRRD